MGINIEAEVHGNRSGERKIVKIGPKSKCMLHSEDPRNNPLCTDL